MQWSLILGYSANSRGLTGGNQRLHLLPDDSFSSPKQRVISPNEIASLFGKSSFTPKSTRKDANIEENDLEEENDLDEDEDEEEDDIRTSEGLNSASTTSSLGNSCSQSMPSAPSTFTSSKAYPRAEVIPDAPGLEYLDLTADLDEVCKDFACSKLS